MTREAYDYDDPAPFGATLGSAMARLRAFVRKPLGAVRAGAGAGSQGSNAVGALVIPTVRYRDVPAAIAWLCQAFGMEEHRVVAGEDGTPCYAELTFGSGMLMIAPIEDTAFGKLMVQPDEIGGVETQVCYLYVEDAQAHYRRATAAGAEIVLDIEDAANSGRGYSCRDPEGHVWNFGTYDPWDRQRAGSRSDNVGPRREQPGVAALLLLALAAVLVYEAAPQPSARAAADLTETQASELLTIERRQREAAERAGKDLRERQAQVHAAALQAAERIAAESRAQLVEARGGQEKAERAAAAARAQLEDTRNAKLAAERAAVETRELLRAAENDAKEARAQVALEQRRRLVSGRVAARTRRGTAIYSFRARSRAWCYNPNVPNPASNSGARLTGFCKT